jgi:cell division protein FtsL
MSGAPYVYTPIERTSRRLGLFLLIIIGLTLTMALFFVKTNAQDARETVAQLEAQIEEHESAIAVLLAERAVLRNPDRLRRLSTENLSLQPIEVERVSTLSELAATAEGGAP